MREQLHALHAFARRQRAPEAGWLAALCALGRRRLELAPEPGGVATHAGVGGSDPVEQKRISRFVFFEDAKSSLLGRLLMRQLVSTALRVPWEGIEAGARPKRQAVPR